ncbi:MAG: hypothetical protein ACI3W7_06670 [Oscillospiraceae bacterium]
MPEGRERDAEHMVFTDRLEINHSCRLDENKPLNWRAALVVTKDGVVPEKSAVAAIRGGIIGDAVAEGFTVDSRSDDFSVLIVDGGRYALKNARIAMPTKSDGKNVCDFAGLGSAVAAFNGARVELEDCEIETDGVAKCMIYGDTGADIVIKKCRMEARGGKLYDGYRNNADFNYMVAPPWVLGIMGNARGTNIMGDKTSMVLVDSDVKARNWGVLSTDNGEGNVLAVIDSTLTVSGGEADRRDPYHKIWGSGYGTYILGCDEDFRGVTIHAGTYVGIARDGNAIYRSSKGHIRIASTRTGETLYEGEGRGVVSVLNSDAFGLMAHGNAELILTDGTIMNTGNAAFLLRSGGVRLRVEDGARIHTQDGVLLQIIDDDDMSVGMDWQSEIGQEFRTEFSEKEGWPSENGQITSMMPPPDPSDMPPPPPIPEGAEPPEPPRFDVRFEAADVVLEGNIYNGSGYYGQAAKQLTVVLEKGAALTGCISATETIHVDEKGKQNTYFTSAEYYYLGHVANRPFCHGDNSVNVTLEPGSVWNVRGKGVITDLTVKEGAVLHGKVLIDGAVVVPETGKTYSGRITVCGEG